MTTHAFIFSGLLMLAAAVAPVGTVPQAVQLRPQLPIAPRACLHGDGETTAEATRRTEALAAIRMIDEVLGSFPMSRAEPPDWQELAQSPAVKHLQGQPGAVGDVARKVRWGTSEPLPGWGVAYLAGRSGVRYALTDLRDPCGFTDSSEDPDVVPPRRVRRVPLTD